MKYLILLLPLGLFFKANAQNKPREVILAKESLTPKEIKKINPSLLDTILQVSPNGNLLMKIELAKNLDTVYVENHSNGSLEMIVSRKKMGKRRIKNSALKTRNTSKRDTVYVEDPITGELRMVITK